MRSGDMYVSVPTNVCAISCVCSSSRTMPKSLTLTSPRWLMSWRVWRSDTGAPERVNRAALSESRRHKDAGSRRAIDANGRSDPTLTRQRCPRAHQVRWLDVAVHLPARVQEGQALEHARRNVGEHALVAAAARGHDVLQAAAVHVLDNDGHAAVVGRDERVVEAHDEGARRGQQSAGG